MNINSIKYQGKMRRKIQVLNNIYDGTKFCGAILTGFALVTLIIGSAAGISSNVSMQAKAEEIYATDAYQAVASEGIAKLDEKLANGEINNEQYKEGIDAIYSIPAVMDYAENLGDKELNEFVKSCEGTKEMADTTLGVGLPIFGAAAAVNFGVAASANKSMKKKKAELEEAGVYNVQRSFE